MKRIYSIYSISQIIGGFTHGQKEFEACATAEAQLDEEHSLLLMEFDSFIYPVDMVSKREYFQVGWISKKERLKQSLPIEEAPDLPGGYFIAGFVKSSKQCP